MLLGQDLPDDQTLFHPVYATIDENKERNSLINQTIDTIDSKILDIIAELDPSHKGEYLHNFKKEVLKKKKTVHIEFFLKLLEVVKDHGEASFVELDVDDDSDLSQN